MGTRTTHGKYPNADLGSFIIVAGVCQWEIEGEASRVSEGGIGGSAHAELVTLAALMARSLAAEAYSAKRGRYSAYPSAANWTLGTNRSAAEFMQ